MNLRNFKNSHQPSIQIHKNPIWSINTLLALLFLLSLISPFLNHFGHGLILSWTVYTFWFFTTLTQSHERWKRIFTEIFKKRLFELMMLACWILIIVVNILMERGYTGRLHLLFMTNFCLVVFMEIYYTSSYGDTFNKLIASLILLIGIESFLSLPTLLNNFSLPRMIMDSSIAYQSDLKDFASKSGVGEYSYYTSLAIIFPTMFVWTIRGAGIKKFAIFLAFGSIAFAITLSTFLGANLLLATGLFLMGWLNVVFKEKRIKSLILALLVGLMISVLLYIGLSYLPQIKFISNKIVGLRETILLNGLIEGDRTSRIRLAILSLETFLDHPLFGVGPSSGQKNPNLYSLVGGHSGWLDSLAEYGLLGFGFYISFLLAAIRRAIVSLKKFGDPNLFAGKMVSCVLFLLCGIYNPVVMSIQSLSVLYLMALGGTYRNQLVMPTGSRKQSTEFSQTHNLL